MSFVTCPILRYGPAVVAQKAALVQIGADQQDQFISWAERELLPALGAV